MDYRSYVLERSLGYKLFNASRLINNRLNRKFKEKEFPVTHEQWQIMITLWEEDGQTQNRLACSTQKDQPSISRLIDNMIKRNLVTRLPHSKDRRTNLIYLTPEGREMQKGLIGQAQQTIAEASTGVDREEMKVCMRVLDKIIANLK
ncbi:MULTISPECIES: MarR family winged helix-turn-helix transcriptional regulator [unclassified Paenibacillus]|uniref:MarR family winged helix-turn-helix transcriptional regulator n=1 Tax=unclassified Paenibacillus TaxID=185978 RepID=UPI001AE91BBF|nr:MULTISPECIES: MarR family winged helix-turn-helix transcriptional regulator [unclassified Paenibacillus]MBP1154522.1 DNA-binding MarR family transcriptional regulator [Paenibacillus sp. PvP091]MBP1170094.1 DNA-binding MarR family transcriptional regulator [Paenibacillus sp. PvR098]MBP2441122.1 DNA-binding MarR family transcriptional regulator [Paenibacillus sp. PvP052]